MKGISQTLIFSTVWPEPQSSAAGVRQLQWIRAFQGFGSKVTLSSPSKLKEPREWGYRDWAAEGVSLLPLPMNRWEVMDQIRKLNPDVVMFDRFILEEQFGAIVYEACPDALILLETQDLHFLRRAREKVRADSWGQLPTGDFSQDETAIREIASIERADYSFVISAFEEELLTREFGVGRDKQAWIPMSFERVRGGLDFEARHDFAWIGNFRHAPNADGLRWFLKSIWPEVRRRLPEAKFKIFGAYPSDEFSSQHNPKLTGVHMMGSPTDLKEVFEYARVNVAPLRFGAGVKGKILEGFRFGVPVVTTPIGEEGIVPSTGVLSFPGITARTDSEFVDACVKLYSEKSFWLQCQQSAETLVSEVYDLKKVSAQIETVVKTLCFQKSEQKLPRFLSRILRHELLNSHKYFSKWIELKEKHTLRS